MLGTHMILAIYDIICVRVVSLLFILGSQVARSVSAGTLYDD